MFLAAAVMSIAICLCTEAAVFAETVSGEIRTDNGEGVYFAWEFDTETQTLTVEQPMKIVNYADGEAWKEYEKDMENVSGSGSHEHCCLPVHGHDSIC